LVTYGVKMLPAGRSAIIAYTMPLWTAILSVLILKEVLTTRRIIGIVIGMTGLALLLSKEFTAVQAAPLGALLIVAAAIAWSVGIILTKKFAVPIPTTTLTAWNLMIGGIPIAIGAVLLERNDIHAVGMGATIALLYNIVVAFVICHWVFFRLVAIAPVSLMSLGTLMIPVVAVFSGMVVLGERPRTTDYAALALIVVALATVMLPSRHSPKQ
jgi:drug/metabolite transporter (DMT)-like permease